jgi:hypothetical protein
MQTLSKPLALPNLIKLSDQLNNQHTVQSKVLNYPISTIMTYDTTFLGIS